MNTSIAITPRTATLCQLIVAVVGSTLALAGGPYVGIVLAAVLALFVLKTIAFQVRLAYRLRQEDGGATSLGHFLDFGMTSRLWHLTWLVPLLCLGEVISVPTYWLWPYAIVGSCFVAIDLLAVGSVAIEQLYEVLGCRIDWVWFKSVGVYDLLRVSATAASFRLLLQ